MGNAVLKSCKGRAHVPVILVDGKVETYAKSARVATVLQRHPKHMVVRLEYQNPTPQGRKVTFMRPDQKLSCERQYVVLPTQSAVGRSVDCWTSASKALELSASQGKAELVSRKKSKASLLSFHEQHSTCNLALLAPQRRTQPGLCVSGIRHCFRRSSGKHKRQEQEWRPSLDAIPESPCLSARSS